MKLYDSAKLFSLTETLRVEAETISDPYVLKEHHLLIGILAFIGKFSGEESLPYPSYDTIREHFRCMKQRIVDAVNWLESHSAFIVLPADMVNSNKRVKVYQLTAGFVYNNKIFKYGTLEKQDRFRIWEQFYEQGTLGLDKKIKSSIKPLSDLERAYMTKRGDFRGEINRVLENAKGDGIQIDLTRAYHIRNMVDKFIKLEINLEDIERFFMYYRALKPNLSRWYTGDLYATIPIWYTEYTKNLELKERIAKLQAELNN